MSSSTPRSHAFSRGGCSPGIHLAIRGGSVLCDVGGASATKKVTNFDRHWRNARTLSSHNPTTFKARSVGQYEINGIPLPAKGFF
jgi:hypothetical protein